MPERNARESMSGRGNNRRPFARRAAPIVVAVFAGILFVGCGLQGDRREEATLEKKTTKPITEVLQRHRDQVMGLPGVVGIAQGRTEDGRDCIVVMLKEDSPELRARIPTELEGYPVRIKITGEFRAMGTR